MGFRRATSGQNDPASGHGRRAASQAEEVHARADAPGRLGDAHDMRSRAHDVHPGAPATGDVEHLEDRGIPASQFGRVRTLTRYGMTKAQVADLYEVTIDEIDRIIRRRS